MKFSKLFRTYELWRRGRRLTSYAKRIIKLHKLDKKAGLQQLTLYLKSYLSNIKWKLLSPKQKKERVYAINVLNLIRNNKSLEQALEELGIDKQTVLKHLGKYLFKKGKIWIAKKFDRIQRSMVIYENGELKSIVVTNSKDASIIGEYLNAVKQFLIFGDKEVLKPFENIVIKDADGKKHKLETNPNNIYLIEEQKEEEEFYEIYKFR